MRRFGIPGTGSDLYELHLTPFADVHLDSSPWSFNMTPAGSWTMVYGVIAIGILILLLACFNFMNLATARAMMRAREIALRKTLGARRKQLILQFLGEALLAALLGLVLALGLVEILLPQFSAFLQRPVAFSYLHDPGLLLSLLGVAAVAGLVSGFYPALVLSRFRPAETLRANSSGRAGSGKLRDLLVVLQFAVSIGLGIAALVVFAQIFYARNIEMGFRRDNVVVMGGGRLTPERRQAFLEVLRANPGIVSASMTNRVPFDSGQSLSLVQVPGNSESVSLNRFDIHPDFPTVYGIKLLAGRLLSETRGEDRLASGDPAGNPGNEGRSILVNEAGARRLGLTPQQAAGMVVLYNHNQVRIVGVLADAKVNGALEPIKPSVYVYVPANGMGFSLRLRPDRIPETLEFIDRTWRAFSPGVASQRRFLDESFARLYSAQERQGTMFGIFVAIAILLACLGLFGLAAFTAGRRTREIGIRKVFGARNRDVILLLLWQFSIPVLLANLIAWPIAWYYLQDWLQGFAYRISLSPLYFLAAGLTALLIAWATVFTHAWRVARASPIHALRYE
jgi:putative ABC transport system permease protein